MKIQISGKVEDVQSQSGTTAKGNEWKKYNVLIQTSSKQVQVTFFEKDGNYSYLPDLIGDSIKVDAEIESREYNGKHYTQINGLGIIGAEAKKAEPVASNVGVQDDLPF